MKRVGSSNSQGVIVSSALVVFFLAFLNSYIVPRKFPRIRLFLGVGILYVGLSVLAQFNPKLARGMAALVMLTAVLAEGGGVLNWVLGRGSHDHLGIFPGTSTGTPNAPTPAQLAPMGNFSQGFLNFAPWTIKPQFALPKATKPANTTPNTPGHR